MQSKIFLVDDHPVFRSGLRGLLEDEDDMLVIGEAGDGEEAIERIQELAPDIVVMDVSMPKLNGIETTKIIVSQFPDVIVVALSIHSDKQFVQDMLQAGAAGYILKESVPEELVKGIRAIIGGDGYLSPAITGMIVEQFKRLSKNEQNVEEKNNEILTTKLHIPHVPEDHIHRQRLVELLNAKRDFPVQTVIAPAGYGKSASVSCWLEQQEWPKAWLTLDEKDNDLGTFFTYFVHAVSHIFPGALMDSLSFLEASQMPNVQVLAKTLVNDLDKIEHNFILVIDDYQFINRKEIQDFLTEILRHPPASLHLILISRTELQLPLTRLRAKGFCAEIGVQALRFTQNETAELLQSIQDLEMTEATVEQWFRKTEGWVAGLRLAVLSVHDHGDLNNMLTNMDGNNQYIKEYLFNETLANQPEDIRKFLLFTSLFERFCAPLLDLFCQYPENKCELKGEEIISWMRKHGLFLVPLDDDNRWFRFHHLFRDFLQRHLEKSFSNDELTELYSKVIDWFENQGMIDDALKYAEAINDQEMMAQIIERHRYEEFNRNNWPIVNRWLFLLPEEIKQQPGLLMTQVWILFNQSRFREIPPIIEKVESLISVMSVREPLLGELYFQQGFCVLLFQSDHNSALKLFESALKGIHKKQLFLHCEIELYLAITRQMAGKKEFAIRKLKDSIRINEMSNPVYLSKNLMGQGCVHLLSGELAKASSTAKQVISIGKKSHKIDIESWGHYMLAITHLQSSCLNDALHCFVFLAERENHLPRWAVIEVLMGLTLTYHALGRRADEIEILAQLNIFINETDDEASLAVFHSFQARLFLLQNDLPSASSWVQTQNNDFQKSCLFFFLEIPLLTKTKIQMVTGTDKDLADALKSIDSLLQIVKNSHNTYQTIEILLVKSLAMHENGDLEGALTTLQEVVTQASSGGWIRPFVELGAPMEEMLKKLLAKNFASGFISQLIAAFWDNEQRAAQALSSQNKNIILSPPVTDPLLSILTTRETEILVLLSERLYNKEIAEKLFISTETVKSHLKSIYDKLGVGNRRQAVDKAKEMGLV